MQKNLCKNNFAKFIFYSFVCLFLSGSIAAQPQSSFQKNNLQKEIAPLTQDNSLDSTGLIDTLFSNKISHTETYLVDSQVHYYYLKKSLLDTPSGFEYFKTPILSIPIEALYQYPNSFVPQDEIYYTLLILFLLLGLLRSLFPDYFTHLYVTLLSGFMIRKAHKEKKMPHSIPAIGLNILFLLSGSILIVLFLRSKFSWTYSYTALLAICVGFILSIYLCQTIFIYGFSIAFGGQKMAGEYISMTNLYNNIFSIFALIFSTFIAFSTNIGVQKLIFSTAMVFILLYLKRWLSSYQLLNRRYKVNLFHFFIYLCGVEILPLLLILKTFNLKMSME